MLIARLSKRLFLAFPDGRARQYVWARELENKALAEADPAVEAIVEGRYQEFLAANPKFSG